MKWQWQRRQNRVRLPPKEIAILTDWIKRGAVWSKLQHGE
jgi:hypothetical protein